MNSNQITGFYPGAMSRRSQYQFPHLDPEKDLAIISPGNVEDMCRLPQFFREHGVRYIFDPGQQLPVMPKDALRQAIEGAYALITNDYELNMISRATGLSEDSLIGRALWVVTTLGSEGARVRGADGTDLTVPALTVDKVVDPTGAGDAQRAGFLKGLASGLSVPDAARLGAISASFAIECLGTQEHKYTCQDFSNRYQKLFGERPAVQI